MTTNYIEPETSNVIGVQFGIMESDEILKNTVVEVEKHDTFKDDKPVVKGLFDIQMGTTDNDKVCGTCNQGHLDCVLDILDISSLRDQFIITSILQ